MTDRLQRLIDRQEIMDCLIRAARGVDRSDRELLISAYHPDALDDHGDFVGPPEIFADWVIDLHEKGQHRTMHFLGNHTCAFDDAATAHTETYCVFYGYNRDETINVAACRYVDRFEKRGDGWRIADRVCVLDCIGALKSGDELGPVLGSAMEPYRTNAPQGRDRGDISCSRPLRITRKPRMPGR